MMVEDSGRDAESSLNIVRCDALKYLPPPPVIHDLESVGVCARCILRMFKAPGDIFTRSNLTTLELCSTEYISSDEGICCVCLGILQLAYRQENEHNVTCSPLRNTIDEFTAFLSMQMKKEGHQIEGFCLEITIPPVVFANERAIWLYLKSKYESEAWFSERSSKNSIVMKDALKMIITGYLEKTLGVKFETDSLRMKLTYAHHKASTGLQNSLLKVQGFEKKKTETAGHNGVKRNKDVKLECVHLEENDSDAAVRRILSGLQDDVFCENFILPPEKIKEPCILSTHCYRMPIYIGGRYLKFSRKVSQTRWIIDDERMGEASVEEILGSNILPICKGDGYKFHAAGREDIDVRMLGSGRPFLVEVLNARSVPSFEDIHKISEKINDSDAKYVKVRNLKMIGSEAWSLMLEGEAEKQKQYAAIVWISRPLTDDDERTINSTENMEITQRTPIRVLHRRSPMDRRRIIHWMTMERISGSSQYFLLHLCTQAGTYIKEFVHGDFGRTYPNIGSILGCRAEILQLDVTDIKMDFFD